mmetsp:Transcript_45236/g.127414  ORF Transcript_45236/g.127414 Transcript_45236/m.127414 type:complete len:232 (+) Transcript_45236:672-1367(+)
MHGRDQVFGSVFDASRPVGFQYATTSGSRGGIHFHNIRIDGSIQNDPGTTSNFSKWWNVHKHGLLIVDESVDDKGSVFQDLVKHVTLAATESTPVRKDNEGQILRSEIVDCLGRLVGTIGEPHTTRLLNDGLRSLDIGGICGLDVLGRAVLRDDDPHGEATESSAANHYSLGPPGQVFGKATAIEKATLPFPTVVFASSKQSARIVRSTRDGSKFDRTFDLINASDIGYWK